MENQLTAARRERHAKRLRAERGRFPMSNKTVGVMPTVTLAAGSKLAV